MPVVLTDITNRVWATEQPDDGYIHVGAAGNAGPRLVDVLEFIAIRQRQFDQFVDRKLKKESRSSGRNKRVVVQSDHSRVSEG